MRHRKQRITIFEEGEMLTVMCLNIERKENHSDLMHCLH